MVLDNVFTLAGSRRKISATELYLKALRLIMAGKEELANFALNDVRDLLLDNAHASEFCDTHVQQIMPDLTVAKFNALYGDYKHTEFFRKRYQFDVPTGSRTSEWDPVSSPWIKNPGLLHMIASHVAQLGDEDDRDDCIVFLQKARDCFKLPTMELVA